MARLDFRRLVWALHRGFLRHGIAFGLALAGATAVLALSIAVGGTWWRLRQAEAAQTAQLGELHAAANQTTPNAPAAVLPLPDAKQRFELTRRILSGLEEAGFTPEQIRFKFEDVSDAGLLRQTAVFELKARWEEIAQALAELQATDRSLYIAKLRLERETPDDALVVAEIQITMALAQGVTVMEAAP